MNVTWPWRRQLSPTLAGTLAVLRLLPAVSRFKTALLAAGVLVATLLPIGVTVVTGVLVGSIPTAVQAGQGSAAAQATLTLLAVAAVLIVGARLLGPFLAALASTLGREVDRHLQERVLAAVGRPTGIAHLEDPAVLDLIQNAQGVGMEGRRPGDAVPALASLLPSWLQALGSALILATFHWWLALGWIVMLPVVVYYLQREYLRVGEVASGQAAAVRRAAYYRDLALAPDAAKEIRIWGMLDWLVGRFDGAWQQAMQPTWRARKPGRRVIWLSPATVTLVNLISFALLAWAGARGEIGLAALAVYTQALLGANGYRAFDDANAQLAYAAVTVPNLLELESRLATERSAVSARPLPPDSPREGIRFENVSFRYPGQSAAVLAGLDLAIPAGRSLAIVGENGAGKTTLVKFIARLYDPSGGRILVDGVDLREYDLSAWRGRMAAIFQDFTQYHLSARENVGLGAPALAQDLDRLRAAAKKAGALDLVESLPRGWETVLSRQYQGGVDLSGGQWQRIALARALFAVEAGARVLILDEPTASLDVRAEAELYDRFLEITAGLTTILISHRFSTVRRADRICVLADGKVVEQGTHDELVALGGRYAGMFALQAVRFAPETLETAAEGG
ncbi:MAG TPA: ABC transporter ATP-binding protein [Thermomicrobiaceae bacterium]|nr:ABC transporter ATP-binding protein [Thermomicrobiaceae bacterium]